MMATLGTCWTKASLCWRRVPAAPPSLRHISSPTWRRRNLTCPCSPRWKSFQLKSLGWCLFSRIKDLLFKRWRGQHALRSRDCFLTWWSMHGSTPQSNMIIVMVSIMVMMMASVMLMMIVMVMSKVQAVPAEPQGMPGTGTQIFSKVGANSFRLQNNFLYILILTNWGCKISTDPGCWMILMHFVQSSVFLERTLSVESWLFNRKNFCRLFVKSLLLCNLNFSDRFTCQ